MNWHEYFINLAEQVSLKSKDQSTKVGAVIVNGNHSIISTGYNGFPRGINDDVPARHERPAKYDWTEHAERNAIINAARTGVSTDRATMYMNFAPIPCAPCARAIINSGIGICIGPDRAFAGKGAQWTDQLNVGLEMLHEARVAVLVYQVDQLRIGSPKLCFIKNWLNPE